MLVVGAFFLGNHEVGNALLRAVLPLSPNHREGLEPRRASSLSLRRGFLRGDSHGLSEAHL
jgi:hypothetical protein